MKCASLQALFAFISSMWPWNGPPRRIGALVVGGNGFGCRLMSIKVERLGLR
jgi:hypothetical protein